MLSVSPSQGLSISSSPLVSCDTLRSYMRVKRLAFNLYLFLLFRLFPFILFYFFIVRSQVFWLCQLKVRWHITATPYTNLQLEFRVLINHFLLCNYLPICYTSFVSLSLSPLRSYIQLEQINDYKPTFPLLVSKEKIDGKMWNLLFPFITTTLSLKFKPIGFTLYITSNPKIHKPYLWLSKPSFQLSAWILLAMKKVHLIWGLLRMEMWYRKMHKEKT